MANHNEKAAEDIFPAKQPVSLIAAIEALKYNDPIAPEGEEYNRGINECLALIRQHEAEQPIVSEKVQETSTLNLSDTLNDCITACNEAWHRDAYYVCKAGDPTYKTYCHAFDAGWKAKEQQGEITGNEALLRNEICEIISLSDYPEEPFLPDGSLPMMNKIMDKIRPYLKRESILDKRIGIGGNHLASALSVAGIDVVKERKNFDYWKFLETHGQPWADIFVAWKAIMDSRDNVIEVQEADSGK